MLRDTPTSFNQYQDTTPKNPFDEEVNNDSIQKKKPAQKKNPFDEDLTVKNSTNTQTYKNPFDEDLTKKETISSNPFDEEINEDQDWLNGDGEFPELFNDKNLRTRDYFERAIYENEKIGPVFNAFNAMKQQFTKDLSSTFLEGAAIVTNFVDRKVFEPIVNTLGIDYDAPETEDYITWKMAEITTEKIEETFPTNPEFQNQLITQIGTTVGGVGSMIIPGVAQNKLASKALLSVGNTSKAASKKIAKEIAEDDLIKESMSKGSRAAKTTSSGKVLKEAEPIFKKVANIVMNESVTSSSIIGGLQMGVPEFKAAKEAGLSDGEAFETFLLNYTVGNVLERIPITSFLKRFNSETKGGVVELLKQSTIGGLEETVAESLQTMFANHVASIYYDPDRKMGEGIGEAAGMGFGIGFVLNAIGLSGKILNRMNPEVKKAIASELSKEADNGEVNAYSEAFDGYTDEEIVNMSEEEVDEILDNAVEAFRLKYESEEVDGLIEEADRELQGLNEFEDGTPIDKDLSEESKNQSKDVYSELEDKAFKDKTKGQKHVKTFERYREILEKLEDPVSLSTEERNNLSEELTAIQEGNHDKYLKDKANKEKEESLKLTQEEKVKEEKERAKVALEESKKEIAKKKKAEEAKAAKKAELEEKKKGLEARKKELDAEKKKNQESKDKLNPKSKKSVRKGVKDAKDDLLKRADESDFDLDGTEYKVGLRDAYGKNLSELRQQLAREKRKIAHVSESDPDFEEENKEVARIESDIKDLRDAKEEIDSDNLVNRLNEEITDDPDTAKQLEEDFPEEYKKDPRLARIKDLENDIEWIKENDSIRQKYYEPDLERDKESIKRNERDIEALKRDIEQNPNRYKNNKETSKTEGSNVQSKSNKNEVLQRPKSEPVISDEQVREELDAKTEGEVLEDGAKDGDKGVNTPETPTDEKSLAKTFKKVFDLNTIESRRSAVIGDAMIRSMAKRSGISVEEMYKRLNFSKTTMKDLPKGVKFQKSPLVFKSTAKEGLSKLPNNPMQPDQWVKQIERKGGKGTSQELEWIGLKEYLNEWKKENKSKSIPKEVVEQYINDNQIEIVEVGRGQDEPNYYLDKEPPSEFGATRQDLLSDLLKMGNLENPNARKYLNNKYKGKGDKIYDWLSSNTKVKGKYSSDTKHSQYQLEGGENYREVLLTLPKKKGQNYANEMRNKYGMDLDPLQIYEKMSEQEKETQAKLNNESEVSYKSSHWDEANILAHLRLNERTLPNGERVLFIEEVQSDWAQEGKKKGFASENEKDKAQKEWNELKIKADKLRAEGKELPPDMRARGKELSSIMNDPKLQSGVSEMPYKKTDQWVGMAMRRAMQMAAQEGFDRVAWVTGEQSADRYDLSKQVDAIKYAKEGDKYSFIAEKNGVDEITRNNLSESELESIVGKEVAQKMVNQDGDKTANYGFITLSGQDLKVGGEGMKAFYNSILPKVAKKEAQRFDKNAKVEVVDFGDNTRKVVVDVQRDGSIQLINENGGFIAKYNKNQFEEAYKEADRLNERIDNSQIIGRQLSMPITSEMRMNLNSAIPLFQGEQGAMMIGVDGRAAIYALTNPNVSTPMHELAHVYEHYLTPAEKKIVERWAGTEGWNVQTSEKFARGFERYLSDGKAPTKRLQDAFEKFKEWLINIYKSIKGSDIDIKLNPEMVKIYDTMLTDGDVDNSSKRSAKENFNRKKNKQIRDGKEFPPHVANYLIKNKLEPENYVWDEGSSSLVDIEGNLIEVKEPVKREKLTEDEVDQQLVAKEKEENAKLSKELDNKKKELSEESGMSLEAIDSRLKRNTDLSGLTKNSNESIKRKLKELDRLIVDEKDKKEKERIKELGPVGLALDAIEKQAEISSSDKDIKDLNEAKQIANDSKISEDEKIKKLKDLYKRSSKDVKNLVERLEDRISREYKKTDEYKDRNKKDFKEESEAKKKLKDVEANVVSLSKRIAQKRKVLRTKIIDRLNKENPVFINKEGRKVITDIPEKIIAIEIGKDESLTEDKASLETYIEKYNKARVEAGLKKLTSEQKDILSIQGMTPEKFQREQEKLMSEFGDLGFEEFSKEGGKTTKGAKFNEGTGMSIDEAVEKTKLPPEFSKILKIFNDFIIGKTGKPVEILFSEGAVGEFSDGSPMKGAFSIFNNGKGGFPIKAQIRFSDSKSFAHEIVHSLHLMYKTLDAAGQTDSNIDREINAIRTRFKDSLRTAAFSGRLTKGQEMSISNLMKIFGVDSVTDLNKAYPFSSNQEFLAHLLTEPDVRYLASTLKDTSPRKGKISTFFNNLFDSLIDLIDKITGGKVSNSYRDSVLKLMSEYESKFIKSFDNDSRFIDRAVYDLEVGLPSLQQASKEAKVNENFDNADHVRVLMNVTDRYGRYLGKDRFNRLVYGLKKKGYDISSKDKDIAWNHHLAKSTGKRNSKILENIRKIVKNESDVSEMKNILIDYLQSSIPSSVKKELLGKLLKPIKAAKDTETLKISIVHLEKALLDSEFASEVVKLSNFQSKSIKKIDAPLRPLFRKVKEIKPELLSKEELTHLNSLLSEFTKNNKEINLAVQAYEGTLSDYRKSTFDSEPIDGKEKTESEKEISKLKKLKKRKQSEREVKNYLSKIKKDLSKDKGLIEEMSTEHLSMFASLMEGDLTFLSDSYIQSLKEGLESFYDGGITTSKLMNAAIEMRAKVKIADFLVSTKGFKFGDVSNWLTSFKNSGQIIATLGKLDKNAVKEIGALIYNDIHHADAVTQFEKRRIMNDVLKSARGMSQDNFVRIQLYSNIMDTKARPDMTDPDYIQELEDNIAFFGRAIDNKIESIKNEDGKTQSLKSAEQEKKLFNEIVADFRESLQNPKKQVLTEAESKLRDHVFTHISDIRPRAKFNSENLWNKEFRESFNYTPTIAQGRAILNNKKGKAKTDFSDPFENLLDNLVEFNDENAVNASQSGTTKNRQRNVKDGEHNLFYDNNFMNVFDNWLGRTLFDINSTQPVKVLSKILKDPEIIKSIGVANVKELKRNITINLKNARGNYRNYSKPVRIIESIKNTAMVSEMGEIKQIANQLLSTIPATYIQNPKGFFKATKLMAKDMKRVEEFLHIHGQGIQSRNILQERFKGSKDYDKTKGQRAVDDAIEHSTKLTTYALRKSDELAAKITFMSAYLELGGTLENPDPKIIGQAETRTTLLQNISNYNFAPTFMTEKGNGRRMLVSFMFTFKSFALNQTLNTYTAIRNAGTSGDARRLLLANIANATVFYYLSRFTRELYREFADLIGLFGVDYEYEEWEKEEQEYNSSLSKPGKASTMIAFDLLLGGGPVQLTSAVEILSDGFYKRRFKGIEDYYGRTYDAYIDNPFFSQKQALPELFGGYKLGWKAVEAAVNYETYQLMFGDQIDEDIPNEMHPSRFNIMETLLMTDLMPLPFKGDVIELIRAAERAAKAEVRAIKEGN